MNNNIIKKCTVEIRPIQSKKWHGKIGQEDFSQPKKFGALVNPNNMRYVTGLNEQEIKHLKEEKGFIHDLNDHFDPDSPHDFWDTSLARIELKNSTTFLEVDIDNKPLDYIKYKIIKNSRHVANSMKEYEQGLYPEATHVIINESEEADLEATKIELRNKAIELSSKLSTDRKKQIILLLGGKSLRNQTGNYITVQLNTLLEDDPESFIRYAEAEDKELLENRALVLECLEKQILIKRGHKVYYHDAHLGEDDLSVAQYLSEVENQDLLFRLKELIQ